MEQIPRQIYEKSLIELEKRLMPYKIYYDILTKWFNDEFEGRGIEVKLKEKKLNNIVIYGMGELGKLLYKNLEKSQTITIEYTLDRNIDNEKIKKYRTLRKDDIDYNKKIDAIIITPIYAAETIKKYINNLYADKSIKLILIDEIVNNEGV